MSQIKVVDIELLRIGLIYMIKKPLIFFMALTLSSSCVSPNSQSGEIISNYILGNIIDVDQQFYDDALYSFARVNFGRRSSSSIVVLSSYTDSVQNWVSSDGVLLKTAKGMIFSTSGLERDFYFTPLPDELHLLNDFTSTVRLYNPDLKYAEAHNEVRKVGLSSLLRLGQDITVTEYKHHIYIPAIRFSAENTYFVDNNNQVIRSTQSLHPFSKEMIVDFYYKY